MVAQQGKPAVLIARVAIGLLAPLIVYFVIRPHVTGDTEALALGWLVPVLWTLGSSLLRRRLEPLGLLGVVAYGIALAIATFFGVGSLALKLHHAVVAGAIGLVFLISVALGKPILLLIAQRRAKISAYSAQYSAALTDPKVIALTTNLTLIIGGVTLADAAVQTVLALALFTSAFLVATTLIHVATILGIGIGVAVLLWLRAHHYDAKPQATPSEKPTPPALG